jgi:predicted nucleic acid-binding protein
VTLYLLDTDVVSNFRRPRPSRNLLDWARSLDAEALQISAMTVFEIQVGAEIVARQDRDYANRLSDWLDTFVLSGRFGIALPDVTIMRTYARMFADPAMKSFVLPDARSKQPRSGADLILAATAIHRGLVVATGNVEHFRRIHVRYRLPGVYNPLLGAWAVKRDPPDRIAAADHRRDPE